MGSQAHVGACLLAGPATSCRLNCIELLGNTACFLSVVPQYQFDATLITLNQRPKILCELCQQFLIVRIKSQIPKP